MHPLGYSLSFPYKWSSPSNVGGILARLPTKYHHSPFDLKDRSPSMLPNEYMIVPQLLPTKSDDRPYECARISLQVALYDHLMSLRMSLYIQRIKLPTK